MNETIKQCEARMFNIYRDYIEKYEYDGKIRFILIEDLCRYPEINPYDMAKAIRLDGYIIVFDDSTISMGMNLAKRKRVYERLEENFMPNNKFELFMCSMGNGIVVCNKAIEEHGDYKSIAYISKGGNVKFYVNKSYIPSEDMEKIKKTAEKMRNDYATKFSQLTELEQYQKILDYLPLSKFIAAISDKRGLTEKLPELRANYFAIV